METLGVQTRIPIYTLGSVNAGEILQYTWEDLETKLMKQISSLMGEHPFTCKFIRRQFEDHRNMELCLAVTAEISQVEIVNHQPIRMLEFSEPEIRPFGEMEMDENKYCEYCGGTTPDDERGMCGACGGRRHQITTVTEVW